MRFESKESLAQSFGTRVPRVSENLEKKRSENRRFQLRGFRVSPRRRAKAKKSVILPAFL